MRRAAVPLAAGWLAVASISTAETPPREARAPSRLLVSGAEYRLTLSRPSIRRGVAVIQFLNRGEDDHDLRLRRISGPGSARRPIARWSLTRPDGLAQRRLRLGAGRYRLWCSLPGHRTLGMQSVLKVSRERPKRSR